MTFIQEIKMILTLCQDLLQKSFYFVVFIVVLLLLIPVILTLLMCQHLLSFGKELLISFLTNNGLNQKHLALIREATTTGKTVSPFGRVHEHQQKKTRQGYEWYVPDITNHINQGLGADVMVVARVLAYRRWCDLGLEGKFVSTVHDSIVMDVPDNNVKQAARVLFGVFDDLPKAISEYYKVDWNLPMICEIGEGKNQKDLQEIKKDDIL